MIWLFLLSMVSWEDDTQWWIQETGIFQPLQISEIVVDENGGIYILNFNEAMISRFDAKGNRNGQIGSKGEGPGEFRYPNDFFLRNGKLAVFDIASNSVSYLKPDGEFIRRVKVPIPNLTMVYTGSGWVTGQWERDGDKSFKPRVYWYDDDFQNRKELLTLPEQGQGPGLSVEMGPEGMQATFSPINSRPLLSTSRDGKVVYVLEPITMKVHVIDPAKGAVTGNFKHASPVVPFDEAWAEERFEQIKEMLPPGDRNLKFQRLYPRDFPIVRSFHVNGDGNLVFDRWIGDPENRNSPVVLDPSGQEVRDQGDWDYLSRVAAIHGDYVFLTTFDKESEEAGVVKVKASAAQAFAAANPIEFDGLSGRRIEMSD